MKRLKWNRQTSVFILAAGALVGCQPKASAPATQPTASLAIPAASLQRGPTLVDLTGGDLGIGGGFLVGAASDEMNAEHRAQAVQAAQHAEQSPATLSQVRDSKTADLNGDGFVTLDEILAMYRAGLSQQEIGGRLTATHFVFHITPEQERYLTDRGVTPDVITTLHNLNSTPVVK